MKERFLVTALGKQQVILGYPWLEKANPKINWKKKEFSWCDDEEEQVNIYTMIREILERDVYEETSDLVISFLGREQYELTDKWISDQYQDVHISAMLNEKPVKSVPKYHGNGCRSAGKRGKVIPRSVLRSRVCAGQRAWLQPGGCALMGCRCPISDGKGWAKAQPGRAGTRLRE